MNSKQAARAIDATAKTQVHYIILCILEAGSILPVCTLRHRCYIHLQIKKTLKHVFHFYKNIKNMHKKRQTTVFI